MSTMRTAKTISIPFPPDLPGKAQATSDPEWDALLARTRAVGKSLGITTESDVERFSDEFRGEKHHSGTR